MNDFHGLLSNDFGFKPQGKSAPMAPPKTSSASNPAFNFEIGGGTTTRTASFSKSSSASFLDDHDNVFPSGSSKNNNRKAPELSDLGVFDDVFGGSNSKSGGNSSVNLDSIFTGSGNSGVKFSSLPVYDKPVYDDDVFDDVPGLTSSSSAKHEDVFPSSSKKNDAFDDILGGLGRKEPESKGSGGSTGRGADKGIPSFDDLLPGFGGGALNHERKNSDSSWHQKSTSNATKKTSSATEDPFVVLESTSSPAPSSSGLLDDPLEQINNLSRSSSRKVESSASRGVFDEIDPLDGLGKSMPTFSSEMNDRGKDGSPLKTERRGVGRQNAANVEVSDKSYGRNQDRIHEKKMPAEEFRDSPRNVFSMPSVSTDSHRSVPDTSPPSYADASSSEKNVQENMSPKYEDNLDSTDDIWLTVSEIPLFTQPTAAPPPSRPPPPRSARFPRTGASPHANKNVDEYSSFPSSNPFFQAPKSAPVGAKNSFVSPIDELEEFAMGKSQNNVDGTSDLTGEDMDANSVAAASAAAMKEAMDRAEAKFKHAKGVRERESAKAARMQQERGERTVPDAQEREYRVRQEQLEREQQNKEREEEEKRQKEEEERRRIEREKEEKEREKRRLDRERELARQAVERATREARERAAADARARAEKAAVGKAQTEARERAERAAVQRAQAEARERAARDAKERAEKVAADARERARAEAREKEARERATAAAAAKANQQKNENDLESFFGMGSRPSSAPRPRTSSSDPVFDSQFQNKQAQEPVRTSVGSSTTSMRKASSSTSIVDDLSSIFGAPPSSGDFQDVEGETEERRRARLERHQRTQERAAKALAEKNQRDLQVQREQAERHRIAETLDSEIKRWAAGKEGNLRALLSTLQYVLWPECGWQPVSLTDLITAASVKKVYRKATLCIHPDKVQQKGATLQQKYIAEKVFDLLKEAWNKFNSEELF